MGMLLRFFLLDFVMDILLIICDYFLEFKEGAAWNLLTLFGLVMKIRVIVLMLVMNDVGIPASVHDNALIMIRVMKVTRKVGKKIIIISTKHQSSQRVDIRRGVENKGALLHNQAPPRSSQGNPDPLHITPLNLLWHPIPYSANSCSRLNQCRLPSGPPYPNQSHFHSS